MKKLEYEKKMINNFVNSLYLEKTSTIEPIEIIDLRRCDWCGEEEECSTTESNLMICKPCKEHANKCECGEPFHDEDEYYERWEVRLCETCFRGGWGL